MGTAADAGLLAPWCLTPSPSKRGTARAPEEIVPPVTQYEELPSLTTIPNKNLWLPLSTVWLAKFRHHPPQPGVNWRSRDRSCPTSSFSESTCESPTYDTHRGVARHHCARSRYAFCARAGRSPAPQAGASTSPSPLFYNPLNLSPLPGLRVSHVQVFPFCPTQGLCYQPFLWEKTGLKPQIHLKLK